jgi:outer membrane scaffolding protein for murein synthesis (MipA/OmpV family)
MKAHAVLLGFLALGVATAAAAEEAKSQLMLGAGLGRYETLLHNDKDNNLYLVPRWQYYQGRFFVENLDLGFNLVETPNWSIDLSTKQSFDAVLTRTGGLKDSFVRGLATAVLPTPIGIPWDADLATYVTPQRRQLSYLGGASFYYRFDNVQLSTSWHTDISGVHQGSEWFNELAWRGQFYGVDVGASAIVRRVDTAYSNYYFGVWEQDTKAKLYSFKPGGQWIPATKLSLRYGINDQWALLANWKREYFPEIYERSLYFRRLTQDIWFTGVVYTW